jgi:tRNA(Ile)-lysidine synthase
MPDHLDIGALFDRLDQLRHNFGPRFIIGLSGGGDSLALAHLCAQWQQARDATVTAICIDHGFRAHSATEAHQACVWAQGFGLSARVVTNSQPKPVTRLQEHARNLRHTIFAKAAYEMGGAIVLLGHTLDDQAETIAFRLARKTGLDGLSGMREVTRDTLSFQSQKLVLARPLLTVRRQALRAYLTGIGQDWIEDPSNESEAFARIRVRKRLAMLGQHERLAHIGVLATTLRETQEQHVDSFLRRAYVDQSEDDNRLDLAAFRLLPPCLRTRVLSRQIGATIDNVTPISSLKLDRLSMIIANEDFKRATLKGVAISANENQLTFSKAPPRRSQTSNT